MQLINFKDTSTYDYYSLVVVNILKTFFKQKDPDPEGL